MKKTLLLLTIAALGLIARTALADDHDMAKPTYIYATYFYCDVAGEEAADAVVERRMVPVYEKALKDGEITGWGFLKHHTGGKWRRLTYHMANGAAGVIKASDAMGAMRNKDWTDADNAFGRACHSHVDYVWRNEAGQVSGERGKVGMSVYFKCNMNDEARADEIVKTVFAPVYDAHLGKGMLTSWGWISHVVGGGYRRALTMTAENIDDLMTTRAKILEKNIAEGPEFVKICGSHEDYIWDVAMEGR